MSSIKVSFHRKPGERGTVQIEAVGFAGKTCEAATARLERALGMRIDEIKKPEWYDEAAEAVRDQLEEGAG